MRNGSWSNGQLRRRNPRSSGLRPFLKTSPSTASSRSRSCAGASSGITRNSNKSSGSGTSRDEVGEASTTMPLCASPPTPSWSPNGRGFPLRTQGDSKKGVFGGDKVGLLIQDLLIEADREGGHERCSRAQSGPDPVGSLGRHPGPARSQRTPLSLALCPDAVAGRYAGRRQRPVLDLPLGTPAPARGAVPARPQAGALPRHVPLLLQGPRRGRDRTGVGRLGARVRTARNRD